MFAARKMCVFLLLAAAGRPMMAARTGATSNESAETAALPDGANDAAASTPARSTYPALSASMRRVMALSAHVTAARQAMQLIAERSAGQLPAPSTLEQLPVVEAMRRHAGERWNTSDSSRPSDFALCYRVSRVMGFQVIPGDLTPAKLPTPKMLSVKNQGSGMGVLVGMTFRLGRMGR